MKRTIIAMIAVLILCTGTVIAADIPVNPDSGTVLCVLDNAPQLTVTLAVEHLAAFAQPALLNAHALAIQSHAPERLHAERRADRVRIREPWRAAHTFAHAMRQPDIVRRT